jgi:RecA/RadA recombinase
MRARSALELLRSEGESLPLRFGCSGIDRVTGGLQRRSITELVGEAGSGKTQFSLQLALQCVLPLEAGGLGASCAYISTPGEGGFPIRRLQQMAMAKIAGLSNAGAGDNGLIVTQGSLLENIHIENCGNIDDFLNDLVSILPHIYISYSIN